MNYEAWTDTSTPILLDKFNLFPETRPHVGDLLNIKKDGTTYKIHRTEPTDNPSDQTVKYFVSPHKDPVTPQTQINDAINFSSW